MTTILFDTDDAIFIFTYDIVIKTLKHSILSNDEEHVRMCLAEIESRTVSGAVDITITRGDEGDNIANIFLSKCLSSG
ncbi:MAG TPA: hypothetical protein VEI57_05270 [Nitrospirota bacterium]|nr:hypothetical protein [Nitrospirota bacterium]